MRPVIGLDIGSHATYVAEKDSKGIATCLNDLGDRSTPYFQNYSNQCFSHKVFIYVKTRDGCRMAF